MQGSPIRIVRRIDAPQPDCLQGVRTIAHQCEVALGRGLGHDEDITDAASQPSGNCAGASNSRISPDHQSRLEHAVLRERLIVFALVLSFATTMLCLGYNVTAITMVMVVVVGAAIEAVAAVASKTAAR